MVGATSCVEAGVYFSFRSAFRESWGLLDLLQIAGRASRLGAYDDAEVRDFRHDADMVFSLHPQITKTNNVIDAATQTVAVEPELNQWLENSDRSEWPGWHEMMLGACSYGLWGGPPVCQFREPPAPRIPGPHHRNHAGLRRRPQPAGRRPISANLIKYIIYYIISACQL